MEDYGTEWDYYQGDEEEGDDMDVYDEQVVSPVRDGASVFEIYKDCFEPTLYSAGGQIIGLLCCCLAFRILTQLWSMPRLLCHFSSIIFGLLGLFSVIGANVVYTAIFATFSYACSVVSFRNPANQRSYSFVSSVLLVYLVFREYFKVGVESWEEVRGVQMIIVLKSLSVCHELSSGQRKDLPPLIEYFGYIFCPANVVFGPWIPFSTYIKLYEPRKSIFGWVIEALAMGVGAFGSLGFSSCIVYWMFLGTSSSWLLAVRDALSVRFSHYFISYVSELTSKLSGCTSNTRVAVPYIIEFPRSLVDVVVHWNIPMHRWLKIHVFRPASQLGAFWAVFLTFLVSSMLHGMNFGLTAILLSLGLYTYVEYTLREKLASIFEACIRSRSCSFECGHKFKCDRFLVRLVNFGFGIWAYFNLTYLGVMMDKSHHEFDGSNNIWGSIQQDLNKWERLSFLSHWTMLSVYLGSLVI